MILLLIFLAGLLTTTGAIARRMTDSLRNWPRWCIVLVSGAAIPVLLAVPDFILFDVTSSQTKEECGVDACGMIIGITIVSAWFIALLFVASLLVSAFVVWLANRPGPDPTHETFQ